MVTTYLPTIIANGKEYTNMYYNNYEEAKKALDQFIQIFKDNNDSKIERSFIQEVTI